MPPHTIKGTIERIIFQSEETHFTVAKLQEEGKQDLTTIVGPLLGVNAGETLELRGYWVHSKDYGEQFKVEHYQTFVPATLAGIEKYLGSGLIKGIGPVTAHRITSHFKLDTLDIIEDTPQKLFEVKGVGEKTGYDPCSLGSPERDQGSDAFPSVPWGLNHIRCKNL